MNSLLGVNILVSLFYFFANAYEAFIVIHEYILHFIATLFLWYQWQLLYLLFSRHIYFFLIYAFNFWNYAYVCIYTKC